MNIHREPASGSSAPGSEGGCLNRAIAWSASRLGAAGCKASAPVGPEEGQGRQQARVPRAGRAPRAATGQLHGDGARHASRPSSRCRSRRGSPARSTRWPSSRARPSSRGTCSSSIEPDRFQVAVGLGERRARPRQGDREGGRGRARAAHRTPSPQHPGLVAGEEVAQYETQVATAQGRRRVRPAGPARGAAQPARRLRARSVRGRHPVAHRRRRAVPAARRRPRDAPPARSAHARGSA